MDRRAKGRDIHRGDVRRRPRPSCCPQVRPARTVSGLATATGLPTDVAATLAPLAHSDSVLHDNPLMTPRPIRLALLDTVR
ncbi:hypothetical protein ADL12_30250 [Streptomyces regalis]|uniref:Uncharacterized protein n=2 Tax=Streptomyces regalis TaxID=68262 RepID=A0A101JI86_9ACTN|nr:hypothetical protein ADL12_30250 [Streptomyces regalis]